MNPEALARRYLDIFYGGRPLDELYEILAPKLRFEGPLATFDSAEAYIDALKADPPAGMRYQLIQSFKKGNSVNLIYDFEKGSIKTRMSQLFVVEGDKISRIQLIFDSAVF